MTLSKNIIKTHKKYIITYWKKNKTISKIKKGIDIININQTNIINICKLQG